MWSSQFLRQITVLFLVHKGWIRPHKSCTRPLHKRRPDPNTCIDLHYIISVLGWTTCWTCTVFLVVNIATRNRAPWFPARACLHKKNINHSYLNQGSIRPKPTITMNASGADEKREMAGRRPYTTSRSWFGSDSCEKKIQQKRRSNCLFDLCARIPMHTRRNSSRK